MEVEPLLDRENGFSALEFMNVTCKDYSNTRVREKEDEGVELIDMGQSLTRTNRIQDGKQQDYHTSDLLLKCQYQDFWDFPYQILNTFGDYLRFVNRACNCACIQGWSWFSPAIGCLVSNENKCESKRKE